MTLFDSIEWSNLPAMEGDILKGGIIRRSYGLVDVIIHVDGSRTVQDTGAEDRGLIRNRYDVSLYITTEPQTKPFCKKWSSEERVCDSKILESTVQRYIEELLEAIEHVFA